MEGKVFVLALALVLQLSLCKESSGAEDAQPAKDTEAIAKETTAAAEVVDQRAVTALEEVEDTEVAKRGARNDLDSEDWVPNFCEPGHKFVEKCNRCWCVKPGIPVCTVVNCEILPKEDWPQPGDY